MRRKNKVALIPASVSAERRRQAARGATEQLATKAPAPRHAG